MSLIKGLADKLGKANEALATAQKSWRDESLSAREAAVAERETAVAQSLREVGEKLEQLREQEGKQRFRRLGYLVAALGGVALGFLAGIAGSIDFWPEQGVASPAPAATRKVGLPAAPQHKPAVPPRLIAAINTSDDYETYAAAFQRATKTLIDQGTCTFTDFETGGPWQKSATTYAALPVYFTYCGNHASISGRIYLNAETGEIFR
jgi:hypothetical protein